MSRAEYMREYRARKKQLCLVNPINDVESMHEDQITDGVIAGGEGDASGYCHVTITETVTESITNPNGDVMKTEGTELSPEVIQKLNTLIEEHDQILNTPMGVIKEYENKPNYDEMRKQFNFSALVLLLLANSYFLCHEQVTFYRACGYTLPFSIFLAILLEITPIALAYFATVYKKPLLNFAIIPAIFCIGAVIFLGLESRANLADNVTRATDILTQQVSMLQEQAKEAEGKKLDRIQSEILKKQEILRQELPKKQADTVPELWIFAVIRFFAFVYNLIFAKLLAGQ